MKGDAQYALFHWTTGVVIVAFMEAAFIAGVLIGLRW